jgi:glyoxylate/hydroxypyruvate reductase
MTLLLTIQSTGANWSPAAWRKRFAERMPEMPLAVWPEDAVDPAAVRYIAAWKPPPGLLATFPNLSVIFNLGAGVDALLEDRSLPNVPIARAVSRDLTGRMTEYVVMHVLMHHRQHRRLAAAQAAGVWDAPDQHAAPAVRVGLMGLGELGRDAAEVLLRIGFRVSGWSRSPRAVPGVTCFDGQDGIAPFLAQTDILVVLLPSTPDTHAILNYRLFKGLARDGVLGAPMLINAGRGRLQVEADILKALDDGTLGGATLDVFETEPLPRESRLWAHPKVTITPHNAADSDPDALSEDVVAQIRAIERGAPLRNVINRKQGY